MQIHISPRDVKLTPAIHSYVAEKIGQLEKYAVDLIGAHIAIWHDNAKGNKHAFVVKVHLAVPGPDIHAEDRGHDLYQAFDLLAEKLETQLRHRKAKRVDKTREASRRAKNRRRELSV